MSEEKIVEERQFQHLVAAIKNGSLQQVEDILRSSPPTIVNLIEPQFRQPSLYFAALRGEDELSYELIKLLIRNGANPRFKDHNEQTILFYICREGKEKCAELLLSHGLSLDDVDVYGQTPIFYAVSENRVNIISKYATKDRVNHVDKLAKQTPLYYAARRGHLSMASLLLERGADITLLDSYNKTAVEYARKAKFMELADFLNAQLKKIKDASKNEEPERKPAPPRRKEEVVKEGRSTYKLVHLNQKGESRDLTEEQVKQIVADRPELASYLANPETIPSETNEESWDKAASRVLNYCSKIKGAFYFQEPVDPVKYNIMDYFDIVTHPMDLGTVRKRLSHNFYQNANQFVRDMNLIWNNSYQYNGAQHIVSKAGKEVQEGFSQQIVSQGLDKYLSAPETQKEEKKHEGVYHQEDELNERKDMNENEGKEERRAEHQKEGGKVESEELDGNNVEEGMSDSVEDREEEQDEGQQADD